MDTSQTSALLVQFRSVFRGAQEEFTIHVPPFTKNGKKGKSEAAWVGWAKYGSKSFPEVPEGYEKGDSVPVTTEQYKAHLNGDYGLAISPLIEEIQLTDTTKTNVCAYGIIDIDVYSVDYTFFVRRLYDDGFKFVAFISKSGGLHLYFLFSEYEDAAKVRSSLKEIVHLYALGKIYKDGTNGVSKVEVFPEHDAKLPGVKDKGVFLPFYNVVGDSPNKLLSPDGTLIGITKAMDIVGKQLTSVAELDATIKKLPYGDAPYCVQAILLSGALTNGSHRNDFLFTAAIYLKMKYGKDGMTIEMLHTMNERLMEPLEPEHIKSIFTSVLSKDYPIIAQCKKEPMVSFCDREACRKRVYSAMKKDTQNVSSNVELGQVYKMCAETPYYLIEARVAGTDDEFKLLRIDSAENFLNQKTIQKECIDKLGVIPWTVKQQAWEERINDRLQTLIEKEVPIETDTTELSELRLLFNRYLTHKQALSNTPQRVNLKQVYYDAGKYYFKTEGLKEYLRIAKYTLGRTNLREQLLSYGCSEGTLTYDRPNGSQGIIRCWIKETDATLAEMEVFFDDVLEDDDAVLSQHTIEKWDSYDDGADGTDGADDTDDYRF